jgi:cyclohexadieny/prephenate dehydrogenase
MQIGTLAIVGVGLIGGSIGLAVKRRRLAERVIGVGRRQESLDQARRLGAIDDGFLELAPAAKVADFMIFCTPVHRIAGQVLDAAVNCSKGAVITDAGSAKATIVSELDGRLPRDVNFVGGHPLAGSEKRGPQHADADLFRDRLTILTPRRQTNAEALERVTAFWTALGSRVKTMTPEEHDRALALTSHVPHLLASALAGSLPAELSELTASGFRDTTRIAAGDPELWTGIFLQNQPQVLAALDRFDYQLNEFRAALLSQDEARLRQLLEQAKRVRDALGS